MPEITNGKYIFIGIPSRGLIHVNLAQWLADAVKKPFQGYSFDICFRSQDPTDCNRNAIVKKFLSDGRNEWLLFIDDDMIPYYNLFEMINRGKKVISGLTCIWQGDRPYPLIMKYLNDKKDAYKLMDLSEIGGTDPLIKVDGIGAACLLIHRDVLVKMKPPWFEFIKTPEGELAMSEDFSFCKKVHEIGYDIFIDPEQPVGHMKWNDLLKINELMYRVKSNDNIVIHDLTDTTMRRVLPNGVI